jgi:hypothetical protein
MVLNGKPHSERVEMLYINSKNRYIGTPSDFYVTIPNNMINLLDRKGRIKFTVMDAIINRSWYSIQENNNTFTVSDGTTSTEYNIPVGYHSVKTLKTVLQELLVNWTITWDKYTDKCTFKPPNNGKVYTLSFNDASCELFGFKQNDTPSGTYSSPIVSGYPLKVNRESAVLIHADIPKLENSVVDNILQSDFYESDVIIKIPIDVAPFDNLIYMANGTDLYSFVSSASNINEIRFWISDEHNRRLEVPYDWTLTMRIEYIYDDEPTGVHTNIERIRDYLKYIILSLDQKISK